ERTAVDMHDTARIVDAAASSNPPAGATERLVADKRAVRHAEDATRPGEVVLEGPASAAAPAGAANSLVLGEPATPDGRDRAEFIIERTSNPGEKAVGADGLVVEKAGIAHRQRGAFPVLHGSAPASTKEQASAPRNSVFRQRGTADRRRAAQVVEGAA